MSEQTSACTHEPRYREYYRDGLYKCWECKKIIDETTRVGNHNSTFQPPSELEDFQMIVNKLSYIVNNLGIKNSFDRTRARNCLDEAMIAFNTYIKTLTNESNTIS